MGLPVAKARGCWPGHSAQSLDCSLLLSLTHLREELWLQSLGSPILVGSVLAVDKSLMSVLLMQARTVRGSDSMCNYPVHAGLCPCFIPVTKGL